MKKQFAPLLAATLLALSCSNDFEVAAPWQDIPVVYGLLNIQDGDHFVRIEKAFLDPDANALDVAQIPDSIYYDNITVRLQRLSNGATYELQRVDGNLLGIPREEGVFANSPNWLYTVDSAEIKLKAGERIRLIIERGDGLPEVTAETDLLDKGKLRTPNPTTSNNFNFDYNIDSDISWSSDAKAKIFDVTCYIKFAEISGGQVEEKVLEWVWNRGLRNDNNRPELVVSVSGREFYEFMRGNIEVKPGVSRVFQGIDVVIVGGGEELEKYINVAQSNTGITGSQEIPTYTNLSEGRGVFSSVSRLVAKNVLLTQRTRDSLANGIITRDLNF
jgi:hypothetical protein